MELDTFQARVKMQKGMGFSAGACASTDSGIALKQINLLWLNAEC